MSYSFILSPISQSWTSVSPMISDPKCTFNFHSSIVWFQTILTLPNFDCFRCIPHSHPNFLEVALERFATYLPTHASVSASPIHQYCEPENSVWCRLRTWKTLVVNGRPVVDTATRVQPWRTESVICSSSLILIVFYKTMELLALLCTRAMMDVSRVDLLLRTFDCCACMVGCVLIVSSESLFA